MSSASAWPSGKPITTQPMVSGARSGTTTNWCGWPSTMAMRLPPFSRDSGATMSRSNCATAAVSAGAGVQRERSKAGVQQRADGGADARAVVVERGADRRGVARAHRGAKAVVGRQQHRALAQALRVRLQQAQRSL